MEIVGKGSGVRLEFRRDDRRDVLQQRSAGRKRTRARGLRAIGRERSAGAAAHAGVRTDGRTLCAAMTAAAGMTLIRRWTTGK